MADELEAAVVKRGETCMITTLSRSALGLTLRVKVHPAVELFMRGLTPPDSTPLDVCLQDRYWVPSGKDQLLAYRLTPPVPSLISPSTGYPLFHLDRLGRPLLAEGEEGSRSSSAPVNLSYLRLVGISEGAGVSFQLRGVYSLEALRDLNDRIADAQQQFYVNFIRPVNLTVVVSTQEF